MGDGKKAARLAQQRAAWRCEFGDTMSRLETGEGRLLKEALFDCILRDAQRSLQQNRSGFGPNRWLQWKGNIEKRHKVFTDRAFGLQDEPLEPSIYVVRCPALEPDFDATGGLLRLCPVRVAYARELAMPDGTVIRVALRVTRIDATADSPKPAMAEFA